MSRINFYKDLYDGEMQRKEELNNSISIPTGIISAFSGVFYYLISSFDYSVNTVSPFILSIVFTVLSLFTLFFLCKAIYFLVMSYVGLYKWHGIWFKAEEEFDYFALPFAEEYESYLNSLNGSEQEKEEEFNKILLQDYITSSSHNARLNDQKGYRLWRCKKAMVDTLISLFLLAIPYLINVHTKEVKPQEVKIVSTTKKQNTMANPNQNNNTGSSSGSSQQDSSQVKRPQLRIIKEGQNPKENKRLDDSVRRKIDDSIRSK